jgi:hypothetical protein
MRWAGESAWPSERGLRGSPEAGDCLGLVVMNIEYGVELGDLQEIADFLIEVQQFHFATLAFDGAVPAHELSEPGAVDVVNPGQIDENFGMPAAELPADEIAQRRAALPQSDPALEVEHGDATGLAARCLEAHYKPYRFFRATLEAWTRPLPGARTAAG